MDKSLVTASIVLYQQNFEEIYNTIADVLRFAPDGFVLYLIDNSPNSDLKNLKLISPKITYISNPSNPGFGAAHNMALMKAIEEGSNYHFIINPDVRFSEDVMNPMIDFMRDNADIGMMMPQILNEDNSVQNLPKLLPSPYSILMRKLKKPASIYNNFINRYELRKVDKEKIYNAPVLSGCFTLVRISAIREIGMYDDQFFMYFEDWDLSRRIHKKYKTIYFPRVSVIHGYESGANKNKKLFKIFVNSAITYFNKWGWVYDKERILFNKKALEQFQ